MTDNTPPDWALIEAAKRFKWESENTKNLRQLYQTGHWYPGFRALCDMIEKYEKPPVDRKLKCAREASAREVESRGWLNDAVDFRNGDCDQYGQILASQKAIELWEEGFGND